jgi:hypothetical protein
MSTYQEAIAEWQRRATAAADRWARGLSDAQPPAEYVENVPVPDTPECLRRGPDGPSEGD